MLTVHVCVCVCVCVCVSAEPQLHTIGGEGNATPLFKCIHCKFTASVCQPASILCTTKKLASGEGIVMLTVHVCVCVCVCPLSRNCTPSAAKVTCSLLIIVIITVIIIDLFGVFSSTLVVVE